MTKLSRTGLRQRLNDVGIINTHMLLSKFSRKGVDDIGVIFAGGNLRQLPGTHVWSPFQTLKPDGPWYDYGQHVFIGSRAETFARTLEWASCEYAIPAWGTPPVRLAQGERVPVTVIERARQAMLHDGEY